MKESKKHVDLALWGWLNGHGSLRLTVGLDDLRHFFQPKQCYGFMKINNKLKFHSRSFKVYFYHQCD